MGTDAFTNEARVKTRLESSIRSDSLPELIKLASSFPGFASLLTKIVRIHVVIDANIVQQELRWRLGRRRNASARTGLHEAISAGVIIPFAPTFLENEIEEHLKRIATSTRKSVDAVRHEWHKFRELLHFYSPKQQPRLSGPVADLDDLQYVAAANELGLPVYSSDHHMRQMNVPVISVIIDKPLRSYARAATVRIAVLFGWTLSLTLSAEALAAAYRLLKGALRWFDRLPPAVQFAIVAAGIIAMAHPQTRAKLHSIWQWARCVVTPAVIKGIVEVAVQLEKATQSEGAAYQEIQRSLPSASRRSALMYARAVCLMTKRPLTVADIEERIRAEGYISRAKNFRSYLRRVLAASDQFAEVSPGVWAVNSATSV